MHLVLMLFGVLIGGTSAETVRQRLFKLNDECNFGQYQCLNSVCVSRKELCNGRNDCGDNSDEEYCSTSGSCPKHRAFLCDRNYNSYSKCIPTSWKCDGIKDCTYGTDEMECNEDKNTLRPGFIYKKRVAVALYLSNNTVFTSNDTMRDEIAYELSLSLLSRLALKRVEDISSTELASYVNAFLVSCIDPRKFYVLDLVSELRKRTEAQNYTNPSVMLALCNAGEKITTQDVEKLTDVFWTAHRQFWTDVQALSVLALVCAAKQPHEVFDLQEISKLTMELKKRQYRNGTVENLKTTALVMQALFASEHEADEDNFDEEKALKQILLAQKKDGSFGNLVNTYYVLPVLNYKSLVNISSSHCDTPVIDEKEALKDLMNQVGDKRSIQYSLWIGNNRTIERTITLNVPVNISFYRIMEFAAGVDYKYRFEYNMRNGKPYIFSISDTQDDPENGMMWHLFEAVSDSKGDLKPITKSPADVFPSDKQHLVFWYKCVTWTM
ncbi:uncharacterized protein TNIN_66361 [Trichonephila inaurata madagascariensis]|uniref:Uncharacterized protein n=1 Tax=Trichonephila inaurata madagascariensis TaxID=2747483 RepID=A0A8X6X4R9_9ARAC|nr:uncharacterized protein TNIN_66361 [Trichonephila inaurata madagascariensis]